MAWGVRDLVRFILLRFIILLRIWVRLLDAMCAKYASRARACVLSVLVCWCGTSTRMSFRTFGLFAQSRLS